MATYRPPTSRKSSSHLPLVPPSMTSSSASSSQVVSPVGAGGPNRTDQIIHRVYLKTVGVLVNGRLTHYGGGKSGEDRERKKDKWFNLITPDIDIHKADLQVYRSVSAFPPSAAGESTVPPLLVAFILDTSDIPASQALLWNRPSGRAAIDTASLLGQDKGKGKEKDRRSGIVLERWTFQAIASPGQASGSQIAPHTAYRLGISHFRSLFSLLRLLPAYRLFRRLRRANNGLRLGLKLWAPEGYDSLEEAWDVMEQDLIGLDVGLEAFVPNEEVEPAQDIQTYDFPSLALFGNDFRLSVEYRPEVDFHVEDLESVLSEKLVDMDEDWFTPTMARHRNESMPTSFSAAPQTSLSPSSASRPRVATPTAIPSSASSNPAPIPQRQGPASIGSFQSGPVPGSRSRQSSSQKPTDPSVTERWSAIGQGLPFAAGSGAENRSSPTSAASGAAVTARRLSGHSIHPFTSSSPSTSYLRSSPSGAPIHAPGSSTAARPSIAHSGSVGRTSSFLSQSGRSFTHAQLANMQPSSASPPVTGAMSREHLPLGASPDAVHGPVSPSSLSFSKQPLSRTSSGRPPLNPAPGSSPFIPGSFERDSAIPSPTGQQPPHVIKRYPSRAMRVGSQGSSGDSGSVPGTTGHNLLRRTSTRESGLRHSLDAPRSGPGTPITVPDDTDIQDFLKTLDALPQPPSLASQRARLPSTSSSVSNASVPQLPSPLHTSTTSATQSQPTVPAGGRAPVTKTQVDDALRRMTGSFTAHTRTLEQSSVIPPSSEASRSQSQLLMGSEGLSSRPDLTPSNRSSSGGTPSVGLLSASRPSPVPRRISPSMVGSGPSTMPRPIGVPRQLSSGSGPSSLGRSASVKKNSPLSGEPLSPPPPSAELVTPDPAALAADTALPPSPPRTTSPTRSKGAARSLPAGPAPLTDDSPIPSRSQRPTGFLSPQPTGSGPASASYRAESARPGSSHRRGPVLLRGGFDGRSASKTSPRQSVSPSHSPIRDFARISRSPATGSGERQAEEALGSWKRYHSAQNIQVGPRAAEGDGSSTRRQSAGAAGTLDAAPPAPNQAGGAGAGQRTAPSSLGRHRQFRSEGDSGEHEDE